MFRVVVVVQMLLLAANRFGLAGAEDKFIFYDPVTGASLDPIEYANALASGSELPELWSPCVCLNEYYCICCLAMMYGTSMRQEFCVDFLYYPPDYYLEFSIIHNRVVKLLLNFNKYSPPPLCLPMLMPFPILSCFQIYNMVATDEFIQLCLKLETNQIIGSRTLYFFDCVRFGINGIQFVSAAEGSQLDEEDMLW